jgi:hypothetical protein
VTTQISELGRARRRGWAVAPVADGAAITTVVSVPRIALTQQEACASVGCSEVYFVEQVRPHLRVASADGKRASVKQGSIAGSSTSPANLVRMRPALAQSVDPPQRTSPALMLALSFGDRGGCQGA